MTYPPWHPGGSIPPQRFPPTNVPSSQNGHTIHVEHRLTRLEMAHESNMRFRAHMRKTVIWHHRVLQGMVAVLSFLVFREADNLMPVLAQILLKTLVGSP